MQEKLSFKKEYRSRTIFIILSTLLFLLICLIIIFPMIKILADSFDSKASVIIFRLLPENFTLKAYHLIISQTWLYRPFFISVYTTIAGTILSMVVTSMLAYVLTQKDLPLKNFLMYMILFTMVFTRGIIPLFLVVRGLRLTNTLWAIILPGCVDTYYLIILRNFFSSIPTSLSESAEIDGCTPFQIYYKLILPLSKAGLASIGLFYIVYYWNLFFQYIIYINNSDLYNFQVMLRTLVLESDTMVGRTFDMASESLKNAVIIVVIIPVMIIYPLLQKYFVKGVNLGAIKE